MNINEQIKELSVTELFASGQYIIPIYQRNYAWGEPEVEQLLQDIMDIALDSRENSTSYYIGSLIVFKRKSNREVFETIDGQQRHTTLSILLSVLKNEFGVELENLSINLAFDSREKSHKTLYRLFNHLSTPADAQEERTILAAYEVMRRFLKRESRHLNSFTHCLLENVKMLRVVVPEDTDLNHYFEIMNNRGEQLEKHEVLKARLMGKLGTKTERSAFAKIWEACADMNRYVQLGIAPNSRSHLFGQDWNTIPDSFNAICKLPADNAADQHGKTLAEIIASPTLNTQPPQPEKNKEHLGTFSSIINFANFLLHVLRVIKAQDIPLDDKKLLETFKAYDPDPRSFILALLKCRMLFDRYIIKRENEEGWSLQTLKLYENKERTFSYVNSFDTGQNQQLVMLLSMFHVSFPAQVYKHWLNAALKYLYEQVDTDNTINGSNYLTFMEALSDKFLYGRFREDATPIDFFELIYRDAQPEAADFNKDHLNQGTHTQNFLFNRLDYLLWKRLKNEEVEVFDGVNMAYINDRQKHFKFTFRTSVEHYYPQNPIGGEKLQSSDIDRFGNLCLISHSNNSRLSNFLPKAKKDYYAKSDITESLKQVFMMSYEHWGPEYSAVIESHEKMMIKVLCNGLDKEV